MRWWLVLAMAAVPAGAAAPAYEKLATWQDTLAAGIEAPRDPGAAPSPALATSTLPPGWWERLRADFPELNAGFDQVVFVRRLTYDANHYYTEFINSSWMPGGTLCVLDLRDGSVREIVPQLQGGVFERFDLSFDARRIVFAWKAGPQEGYRIYEVNVDGSGLRQLTFPEVDEAALVAKYRVHPRYPHGTDDMQPCYLPDGGIVFISTRCQHGVLCDPPDNFTTTVLYRMDADGGNLRPLSHSALSEASPAVTHDGRILYTRWEYVDKGAVSVKCLWVMRPDGSAASEVYKNNIALPPTFLYGRPIPGAANEFVVLGTPHYPQNGVGTVIRLDTTRDLRTRDPMTYMTPGVDIRGEAGDDPAIRAELLAGDEPAKSASKPAEKPKTVPREALAALRADVRKCEERLEKLGEMRAKLQERMADPSLYDEARKADLANYTAKFTELEEAERRAETLWLEAQEALEAAQVG